MSELRNAVALIEELEGCGVELTLRSGKIIVNGPRARVTPEVLEAIRVNQHRLREALHALAQPGARIVRRRSVPDERPRPRTARL